jgi:hypothetical protein
MSSPAGERGGVSREEAGLSGSSGWTFRDAQVPGSAELPEIGDTGSPGCRERTRHAFGWARSKERAGVA